MKAAYHIIGYLALLLPTLMVALDKLVDIADPAVVTPDKGPSFWVSDVGECIWFGTAFVLPALALLVFRCAMSRVWRSAVKD